MPPVDRSVAGANASPQTLMAVRLSSPLVRKLAAEVQGFGQVNGEIAGLLFGSAEKHLIDVQVSKPFPAACRTAGKSGLPAAFDEVMRALLEASQGDPEIAGLSSIGWYSVRTGAVLEQSDTVFHERHFQGPGELALLLEPEGQTGVLLRVYARSARGLLTPEEHRLGELHLPGGAQPAAPVQIALNPKGRAQFYLRAYEAAESLELTERGESRQGFVKSATRIAVSTFPRDPSAPENSEDPLRPQAGEQALQPAGGDSGELFSQRIQAWAASLQQVERSGGEAPVSAAAGAVQPRRAHERPNLPERKGRRGPLGLYAAVSAIAAVLIFVAWALVRPTLQNKALSLRADSEGESILLSWNRQNPFVQSAIGGSLRIDDGVRHREVYLDAEQVANGSLLYRPASDDVTFHIELRGERGATMRQSMRVLDGEKRHSDDLGIAKPPADSTVRLEAMNPQPIQRIDTRAGRDTGHSLPEPVRSPEGGNSQITPDASASSQKELATPQADSSASKEAAAPNRGTVPAPVLHLKPPVNAPVPNAAGQIQIASDSKPAGRGLAAVPEAAPPQFEPADSKPLPYPSPALTPMPPARTDAPAVPRGNMAAIYVPPQPLRQYLPNRNPWIISSTSEIQVQVMLDKNGRVETAHVVRQEGKLPGGLVAAALAAAKLWIFKPASLRGEKVESVDTIVFRFRPANP